MRNFSNVSATTTTINKVYFKDYDRKVIIYPEHKESFELLHAIERVLGVATKCYIKREPSKKIAKYIITDKGIVHETTLENKEFIKYIGIVLYMADPDSYPTDNVEADKRLLNNYFDKIIYIIDNYRTLSKKYIVERTHFLYNGKGEKLSEYTSNITTKISVKDGDLKFIVSGGLPELTIDARTTDKNIIKKTYQVFIDYFDRVFYYNDKKEQKAFLDYLAQIFFEDRTGFLRIALILSGVRMAGKDDIYATLLRLAFPDSVYLLQNNATTDTYNTYLRKAYVIADEFKTTRKTPYDIYNMIKQSGAGSKIGIRGPGDSSKQSKNQTYFSILTNEKIPFIIKDKPRNSRENQFLCIRLEKSLQYDEKASDAFMAKYPNYLIEMEEHIGDFLYFYLLPRYKKNVLPLKNGKTYYRFGIDVPITEYEKTLIDTEIDFEETSILPVIIDILTGNSDLNGGYLSEEYSKHLAHFRKYNHLSNWMIKKILDEIDTRFPYKKTQLVRYLTSQGIIIDSYIQTNRDFNNKNIRGYRIDKNVFDNIVEKDLNKNSDSKTVESDNVNILSGLEG